MLSVELPCSVGSLLLPLHLPLLLLALSLINKILKKKKPLVVRNEHLVLKIQKNLFK